MNTQPDIEAIYKEFREPLKAFISKRITNRDASEDLLHDVFLKIHNQIHSLNDREKLTPWIYQIARNAIVDSFRKNRKTVVVTEDVLSPSASERDDITEKLVPVVRRMMKQLPVKYSEALDLADFNGMKQAEIAKRLAISLSAAKSRVQRARMMLKELLLQCCHFEFDRYGTVFDYSPKNCTRCCETKETTGCNDPCQR